MKTNLFARLVSNFLTKYLPNVKGCSGNTIESYEDTFKLMLRFCASKKQVQPESMTIELFNKELVLAFLQWLEVEQNCIISTRNQRLSALKSFCQVCVGRTTLLSDADDGDHLNSNEKITKINGRLS